MRRCPSSVLLSLLLACGGGSDSVGPTPPPSAPTPAIVTVGIVGRGGERGDNGGFLFSVEVGQYDTITAVPGTGYQVLSLRDGGPSIQRAKVLVVGSLPGSGPMFRIHLKDKRHAVTVVLEQAATRGSYLLVHLPEYGVTQSR